MSSKVFHLMGFINFVLVLCLNTHLLVAVDSSENVVHSYDNAGQIKMYRDEYNGDGKENNIVKISGQDEIEERRDLVLEKVRNLLGLNSFKTKFPRHGHVEHGLLSPSPAPTIEPPAPVPLPAHVHVGHHRLHPRLPSSAPTILHPVHSEVPRRHGDEVKVKKIVIAVAVSSGAVTVISVLGFLLFCWKFGKGRRRSAKTTSVNGTFKGRSKCVNSPITSNKVSLELGPEHFCLHSVEPASKVDLSPVKQNYETVSITWKRKQTNTSLDEVSESGKDSRKSFSDNDSYSSDNVSCSSVDEIISVHEIREVVMPAIDNGNRVLENETIQIEALSSDDESFHSLCGSDSSNVRSSNASEGDPSDPSEVVSSLNHPTRSSPPEHSSKLHNASKKKSSTPPLHTHNLRQATPSSQGTTVTSQLVTPSPPQPPPPPPLLYFSSSHSSSSSKQITSTTASKLPSSSKSDSSSGSNQNLSYDSSSSSQHKSQAVLTSLQGTGSARSIPPPPCPPPPFTKGKNNSLQPPPPPPGPLPQSTAVGKDGIPLPKLKPLHWDKVRATPDRSTVWDNLKSNSFE